MCKLLYIGEVAVKKQELYMPGKIPGTVEDYASNALFFFKPIKHLSRKENVFLFGFMFFFFFFF